MYDRETKRLHWANATQQLRRSGPLNQPCFIGVSPNSVLDDTTMAPFVAQARTYVGRYRDRQAVLTHLSEMSGVEFGPEDHVLHFVNGEDEDLIFWKHPGNAVATLLLSTQDWQQAVVSMESLTRSIRPMLEDSAATEPADPDLWTAEDLDLSRYEVMWVMACFLSTWEADEGAGFNECKGCPNCTGEEHANIGADELHEFLLTRILDRIEAEPDLMQRSILAMREERDLAPSIVDQLGPLESEPWIVRKVNKLSRATVATMDDIEPETFQLATTYLIRTLWIGGPSLPIDAQVKIDWRVAEQESTASNH